jgi:hypothetical protein
MCVQPLSAFCYCCLIVLLSNTPTNESPFIAGEHAAVDNPATMEGAVESGVMGARFVGSVFKQ